MARTSSWDQGLSPADLDYYVAEFEASGFFGPIMLTYFAVISVLEEHALDFPGLIIQSAPKRSC